MSGSDTNVAPDPNQRITPYLPRLVIDWIRDEPAVLARRLDGTIVFIDVSGFTKLSERLARAGNVGAEELAETIGSTFSELLTVAYANGGGLVKFGGDALFLFFSGEHHASRACASAIGMRATLRDQGTLTVLGQHVRLRMSIGVHTAGFEFFLVGNSHRELVAAGPGISAVAELEGAAEAGEILISPETAGLIARSLVGNAKGPGLLLRRAPRGKLVTAVDFTPLELDGGIDLATCVPAGLRSSIVGASQREHRRVAVAFIHFDGTDELIRDSALDEVADRIRQLVTTIQEAADRNGVTFLATDVDRDGGKIILTAGAPSGSGDDERRMLLALREIVEAPLTIPVRIGVNRGFVFAGDVGPAYRRTYTVMGDTVNLAARLMAHASPGEILATREILDRSPTAFALDPVEPFFVKGKTEPVEAWRVGPVLGAKPDVEKLVLAFTGREAELTALTAARDSARDGIGRVVEIVGAAGMGKSRLVDEIRARCEGMIASSTRCELYEATTPYFPLRAILRSLLGLDPNRRTDADAERLGDAIGAVAAELVPWAPLLAIVADVPMAGTPETDRLEEKFRAARLEAVVREVFTALLPTPTVLVIEDAQWIDESSARLLRSLLADVSERPWLAVITRREDALRTAFVPPGGVVMHLGPLAREDVTNLLRDATQDVRISDDQIEALAERSTGNPLFVQELVAAAGSTMAISGIPESVEALVGASIDRLLPQDRDLLRRLAVLGRSFPEHLVSAVLETSTVDSSAWSRVEEFLVRDSSGRLSFEHALVRDSAYEGLAYRARKDLHSRVGDALRDRAGTEGDDPVELLSLHFLRAERYAEAFGYSRAAAEAAREIFADREAAELYERALEAARHLPDVTSRDHAGLRELLGDVRHRSGAFADALTAYRDARRFVRGDPIIEARLQLKVAWIRGWLDRYSEALRAITRGLRVLDGVEGHDAACQRTAMLAWYAQFCEEGGKHRRAIAWAEKAIEAAEAAPDRSGLAHALKIMGWAQMELGELETASTLRRSLALYETLDDLPGQASVLNMLGGFAYWRGEWDEALLRYERARELSSRTGNTVLGAFCATNIGEIALDRGELELAGALFRDAARVWRVAGDRPGSAFVKLLLGRTAAGAGRYDEALELLTEAQHESMEVGAQVDALEAAARIAECHLAAGRPADALRVVDETMAQAQALGGVAAQTPMLERTRGLALVGLRRIDEARAALDMSLGSARSRHAAFEIALSMLALVRVIEDPAERARAQDESAAILAQLGVWVIPEIFNAWPPAAKPATEPATGNAAPQSDERG